MQIFAYVPMDNALGTQKTLTVSMAILIPAFTLVSFTSGLADKITLLWMAIGTVMVIKAGFGTTGFAAVNLLVSNAAGSETVGAVNGLSASIAAVARVISPVLVGSIFAATANSDFGFPFDYHFVFYCLAFISALVSVCSHFGLPASINKRKA
jgi:nitrate/nitrite transporter NarK